MVLEIVRILRSLLYRRDVFIFLSFWFLSYRNLIFNLQWPFKLT